MTLLLAWLTTFAVCVVGSFIPIVNTELYLISAAALSPQSFLVPLVLAATLGQVLGKVVMFYAGRGVLSLRSERLKKGVGKVQARFEANPRTGKLLLFSSATVGLPPLYAVAVVCGAVRMNLLAFIAICSVGRLIHFAAVAAIPQVFRDFWG